MPKQHALLCKLRVQVQSKVGTILRLHTPPVAQPGRGLTNSGSSRRACSEGILKWVKKKTGPATVTMTAAELTKASTAEEVTVVGYFKALGSAEHKAFVEAAEASDATFVETTAADAGKVAGLTQPGIAVMQNFEVRACVRACRSGCA